MVSTFKVLPSVRNVQDGGVERSLSSLTMGRRSSLESLVIEAAHTKAFPSAEQLIPLCNAVGILSKKLDSHAAGKLAEDEMLESKIYALNLQQDKLTQYKFSLSEHFAPRRGESVEEGEKRSAELRQINTALISLDNGLTHYLEGLDVSVAIAGVIKFRTVLSTIMQQSLAENGYRLSDLN